MPTYEIHVETYEAEEFPVIEAKDAYEAAIMYAGRFAPVTIRRTHPEREGDTFVIHAIGATIAEGHGVEVEVYEVECEGHPAGPFDPMGETVYCDGSCRR